jgi:hypothetical protein
MDRYSLIVEQFTIHDTRALHNDTLWLNVGVRRRRPGRFMVGQARRLQQRDVFHASVGP